MGQGNETEAYSYLRNPDEPLLQQNPPNKPKPARKLVARKSGGRVARKEDKDDGKKGKVQPQIENPEDQPGDTIEEPEKEPLPLGPEQEDPKIFQIQSQNLKEQNQN